MSAFLGFLALAAILAAGAAIFIRTPPEKLARWLRQGVPLLLIVAGGIALLLGRVAFGGPLMAAGFYLLRRARSRSPSPAAGAAQVSTVRSRYLEMVLEHDTGHLSGTIIAGTGEGRRLEDLDRGELAALLPTYSDDPESQRLLEAYLDRHHAGWRDHTQAGMGDGLRGAPSSGAMTEQQAYQILGLQPGATVAEVRDAHRRLMKRVHPDHGGTDFLAARLNEAKSLLIDRHG